MKIAYTAGSYRASTEYGLVQNIRKAEAVAIELWKIGYAVICPHKSTAHLGGIVDDEIFLNGCIEIVSRCDLIVMLEEWENSEGARMELTQAEMCDISVFYWPKDQNKLKSFV